LEDDVKVFELTLSPKGQVTFPKEMRDMLNLKAGDQLIYSFIDGQVIITPKNVDFSDLAGLLGPAPNGSASLLEIDAAVLKAAGANAFDDDRAEGDVAA
jgi:antitoxin PrlF